MLECPPGWVTVTGIWYTASCNLTALLNPTGKIMQMHGSRSIPGYLNNPLTARVCRPRVSPSAQELVALQTKSMNRGRLNNFINLLSTPY